MGRKRQFDENAVLERAMLLFWQRGYQATTFALLEQQMGVTGRSLVNCFGDKDALFHRALQAYLTMAADILSRQFANPGVAAIQAFFVDIENAPADSPRQYGCLIGNTLFEMRNSHQAVADSIDRFRGMLLERFRSSLVADAIAQPEGRAELLLNLFWGAVAEIRRTGTTTAIAVTNRELENLLAGWQAGAGRNARS